ncbi:hypothetical protein MPC4_380007 [Methylocella tundrae]|uniref:Uncharacterized protein n=1 Tax=Methylocella tundrae TaxID=227605 RepID=A0A8B6MAS4_METTU|nr:hypothetical protein MPC4_380007 [Methylocella tundrae]
MAFAPAVRCQWVLACAILIDASSDAAIRGCEGLRVRETRPALPVHKNLAEAEGGPPHVCRSLFRKRSRKDYHARFLAFVAPSRLLGEGPAAIRRPDLDLSLIGKARTQRPQRAVKNVGIKIKEARFFNERPGLDQTFRPRPALVRAQLGLVMGHASLCLFNALHPLGQGFGFGSHSISSSVWFNRYPS